MPLAQNVPQIVAPGDTARVRRDDLETSHAAADSNENRVLIEEFVFALLKRRPMNDWELSKAFFRSSDHPVAQFDSPRKRRSDLTKKGQVLATLERRPGRSGRMSVVWRVRPSA